MSLYLCLFPIFVSISYLSYLLSYSQGSGPEDFSHLPPEQRRKKLQGKIDEINKDIQKEMDQRYFNVLNIVWRSPSFLFMTNNICVHPFNIQ